MRVLLLQARRSLAFKAAPVLALLVVLRLASDRTYDGVWDDSLQQLSNSAVLMSVVASGVNAWDSSRDRRRGTAAVNAAMPRPLWRQELTALAGTFVWTLLALTSGLAYLVLVNVPIVGGRHATWGLLVLCALGVTAYAFVGYLLGRALPGVVAAPVAVVTTFVLGVVPAGTPDTVPSFFTILDDGLFGATQQVRAEVLVRQQGVFLVAALAAALAIAALVKRSAAAGALAGTGLVALALAAGALVNAGPPRVERVPVPEAPPCAGSGGRSVCVWPRHDYLALPTVALIGRLPQGRAAGALGLVTSFSEGDVLSGPAPVRFSFPSNRPADRDVGQSIAIGILERLACRDAFDLPASPTADLSAWLVAVMLNEPPASAGPSTFPGGGSMRDQLDWFDSGVREISACEVE